MVRELKIELTDRGKYRAVLKRAGYISATALYKLTDAELADKFKINPHTLPESEVLQGLAKEDILDCWYLTYNGKKGSWYYPVTDLQRMFPIRFHKRCNWLKRLFSWRRK